MENNKIFFCNLLKTTEKASCRVSIASLFMGKNCFWNLKVQDSFHKIQEEEIMIVFVALTMARQG